MPAQRVLISADKRGIILSVSTAGGKLKYRVRYADKLLEQIIPFIPVHGVLGLVDYGPGFFLVVTDRKEVASVHGKQIYQVTGIKSIPLDAKNVVKYLESLRENAEDESDGDNDDDDNEVEDTNGFEGDGDRFVSSDTIFEDMVLSSKHGGLDWMRRASSIRGGSSRQLPTEVFDEKAVEKEEEEIDYDDDVLQKKLLNVIKTIFCSKFCYFSYELDITRSLVTELAWDLTIHPAKRKFYYNRKLNQIFQGTSMELPVMQGFIGELEFKVRSSNEQADERQAKLLILSRRSVERAGVRYLRRGIDDNGNCANWVETEQVLLIDDREYSFVQTRGSVPLFWTQSPYKLQPTPQLLRSGTDNKAAFLLHFNSLRSIYTDVLAISLVEKDPSREAGLGAAYQELAEQEGITLEWFDFHKACSGMRFQNIDSLFETQVDEKMMSFGWTETRCNKVLRRQSGVLRVNCVDCLDRTNVVETACARRILQQQLDGFEIVSDCQFRHDFNTVWADNGDAISRQYSSTNALKGDFTRTQKRQIKGVLTDAYLNLSRYYHGMVADFFTQAVMDYVVGTADKLVIYEFEQKFQNEDPAADLRILKDSAIELCINMILGSTETILGGWWLQKTKEQVVTPGEVLQSCILLVTDMALYICYFDLKKDKIVDFVRIDSSAVTRIQSGVFFTDIFSRLSRDPDRNMGIGIKFTRYGYTAASGDLATSGTSSDMAIWLKIPWAENAATVLAVVKQPCVNAEIAERDIVSYGQARGATSIWGILGHQMKKMVWG